MNLIYLTVIELTMVLLLIAIIIHLYPPTPHLYYKQLKDKFNNLSKSDSVSNRKDSDRKDSV